MSVEPCEEHNQCWIGVFLTSREFCGAGPAAVTHSHTALGILHTPSPPRLERANKSVTDRPFAAVDRAAWREVRVSRDPD